MFGCSDRDGRAWVKRGIGKVEGARLQMVVMMIRRLSREEVVLYCTVFGISKALGRTACPLSRFNSNSTMDEDVYHDCGHG